MRVVHYRTRVTQNCFVENGAVKELRRPLKKKSWQPTLVLANPKSGGKDGEMVIGLLRGLLNPVQVSVSECV